MQSKHWVLIVLLTLGIIAGIVIWLYASGERSQRMLERQRAVQADMMQEYNREIEHLRSEVERLKRERENAGAL